jgi:hypothetical protein
MAGSLIQLSAIGVENVDLTVEAAHTFFKSVYSKHTGFAMEPKELQFSAGTATYGKKGTVKIDRQGDLVADMWLLIDLDPLNPGFRFTNDFGRALIETIQVCIGGVTYDTRIGEYIHLWEELTVPDELHLNQLSGKSESPVELEAWSQQVGGQRLYVPIRFWFTDAYSNALPLVGLYQHEVQLDFHFRKFVDMVIQTTAPAAPHEASSGGAISSMVVMAEYVYLENNERNYFARGCHKYMIDQVQYTGSTTVLASAVTLTANLHFNHPTNEILWVFRKNSNNTAKEHFNFEGEELAPYDADAFLDMRLLLNSAERWAKRDPLYFRGVQPKRHHTRIPRKQIYTYSFGLHPEQATTDPSGNINFSRIDNTQMIFNFSPAGLSEKHDFLLFARSANWIKIERGLSKLYYA